MEPQGDSRFQGPSTPGIGGWTNTCHCLVGPVSPGVWRCVLGGGEVGKEPRPPGRIPSAPTAHLASFRPPGSDHTGCLDFYPGVLTSGQHRDLSLQSSRQGRRLCSRVCIHVCAPMTSSIFPGVCICDRCAGVHICVTGCLCGSQCCRGLERECGHLHVCICVSPLCSEWVFLCDDECLCQSSLIHRIPGSSLSTLSPSPRGATGLGKWIWKGAVGGMQCPQFPECNGLAGWAAPGGGRGQLPASKKKGTGRALAQQSLPCSLCS